MKIGDRCLQGAGVWGGDHGTGMHWGWPCATPSKNARTKHHTRPKISRRKQTRTSYFFKKRKKTFTQQEHQWKRLSPGKSWPVCLISLVKAHGTESPRWHRKRGREHVAGVQTRETEVLAHQRPASQSAACKGFQHVGCHLWTPHRNYMRN